MVQKLKTFAELALQRDLAAKRLLRRNVLAVVEARPGPYELSPDEVAELTDLGYRVEVGAESAAHPGRRWCDATPPQGGQQ